MNILIIGSGGREHALAYRISKSPLLSKLYVLPGNAGMRDIATIVDIKDSNMDAISEFCLSNSVTLVVVGPEVPLVEGITDVLEANGILVFGPSKKAAALEGSKEFAKKLCIKYGIPTAKYESFKDASAAKAFIKKENSYPIVIKADGLAAGKGVVIAENEKDAIDAIDSIMGGKFGAAGSTIVVEEFLQGEELSFFALSDGENVIAFGSAQDHKRAYDNDTGPNTGGMGTISPSPLVNAAMEKKIMQEIVAPTVRGMAHEGIPFKGVLFVGIMMTADGPKVLEYNARFGDPETQVLMMRFEDDIVPLLKAAASGTIQNRQANFANKSAVCVVMAAKGYPGEYQKGTEIRGLEKIVGMTNVNVFHAGTIERDRKILANGGRVLGVTAVGDDIAAAQKLAYQAVALVDWKEGFCRKDIGAKAIVKKESI